MSLLSNRIKTAVAESRGSGGTFDLHKVGSDVLASLTDEETRELALEAIISKARAVSRLSVAATGRAYPEVSLLFPDLDRAYALGSDGAVTKATEELNFGEFRSIVAIREQQLRHDQNRAALHRRVLKQVEPVWTQNPDWVFGRVCRSVANAGARACVPACKKDPLDGAIGV